MSGAVSFFGLNAQNPTHDHLPHVLGFIGTLTKTESLELHTCSLQHCTDPKPPHVQAKRKA